MRYRNSSNDRLQIMGTPAATVEAGEEFDYEGTLGPPFVIVVDQAGAVASTNEAAAPAPRGGTR